MGGIGGEILCFEAVASAAEVFVDVDV